MIEYTARDFEELCRTENVRAEISTIEQSRAAAVRRFWIVLAVTLAVAAGAFFTLLSWGWTVSAFITAAVAIIVGGLAAWAPIATVAHNLKQPVLDRLATLGDLEYCPDGFDPPVFPLAGRALFGEIAGFSFSDLFHGKDGDKLYAIYEGTVTRKQGRGTGFVFRGLFYAFQRAKRGAGETLILPDPGLLNLTDPAPRERVTFPDDPEFAQEFDVQTTRPDDVAGLVSPDLRRALVRLRRGGKVWAWIGAGDVLVAVQAHDRFEPGNLFRSQTGEARVRAMFDEVCAALSAMRGLKAALD